MYRQIMPGVYEGLPAKPAHEQPSLFDLRPIVAVQHEPDESLDARFRRWITANPQVLDAFENLALQLLRAGRSRFGAKAIIERLRWEYAVSGPDGEFRWNNIYTPRLARRLRAPRGRPAPRPGGRPMTLHGTYIFGDPTPASLDRPDPALRRSPRAESIGYRPHPNLPDCHACPQLAACRASNKAGRFALPECETGVRPHARRQYAGSNMGKILQVLAQAERPLTAAEIEERLFGRRPGTHTIPDTLLNLHQAGLIVRAGRLHVAGHWPNLWRAASEES